MHNHERWHVSLLLGSLYYLLSLRQLVHDCLEFVRQTREVYLRHRAFIHELERSRELKNKEIDVF